MEQKEKHLIEVWIKLFSKYWVKKTSVDEIVKEASIWKGTFYLYFENKENLYKKIIDIEFMKAKKDIKELCDNYLDIKKRFVYYLIWTIKYFQENDIIRNMVLWEENYYIWDINIKYLEEWHNKILEILLKDSFNKENKYNLSKEKIQLLSNIIWNFKEILLVENKCFDNKKNFDKFVEDYSKVIVNWFFSNYESILK
jgi:hypothetical protein